MRGPPHLIFIRQTGKTLGRGGFMVSKSIDPIDRHVGARDCLQRMVSGLSQTELGKSGRRYLSASAEIREGR